MFATKNGKIRILPASEKNKILREISQQNKEQLVKGAVASSGAVSFYEGRVKVLLSPTDSDKVQMGEIIIATMTSPDYIVAMKRAGAFITDEGGVTCHAAIVAREMHKPCLIGTKIATKKFKDNDCVRMDLQHGTVTLI
jgi:pyruvate,water dikinase